MRAERLQALGEVTMLHPDDLAPESVAAWVEDVVGAVPPTTTVRTPPSVPRPTTVDLGGPERVTDLARATLTRREVPSMAG